MAKLTDFRDFYYLRGDHVVTIGSGYLQYPIGKDFIDGFNKPDSPIAKIRHNDEHNWANIGLSDSWLTLVDRPDIGTFVNRSGDSMFGDLRMWENARILNTFGESKNPSYSFLGDEDTGLYRNKENSISLVLGSDINDISVIHAERFGSGDYDTNIYMEGDVWIDEITFTRRGGLRLDGDYAYFTGGTGLRLPQGNTNARPLDAQAIIRYNSGNDNFDLGFRDNYDYAPNVSNKWGILSLKANESSWLVRSGDSMFGHLTMTNAANIYLVNGSRSTPSLSFDSSKRTGFYRISNGIALTIDSNVRNSDVVSIVKTGNSLHDNDIFLNGDVHTNEITFVDLRLDGDYAYFTGNKGLKIPRGNNSQRVSETGVFRYNTEVNGFEFYTTEWLTASGIKHRDTWVNRKGDSIFGDLEFNNNARILGSYGTNKRPSITFLGDNDTGIYRPKSNALDIAVGADLNELAAIQIERVNSEDFGNRVVINGDLIVQGRQSILNTEVVTIEDNIITLNKNGMSSGYTGIEVEGDGSIRSHILYSFSGNDWQFDDSRLSGVINPVNDNDATNKIYVDTEIYNTKVYLEGLIEEERIRAIGEETRIEGRLNQEIQRATTRENQIEEKFDQEVLRLDQRIDDYSDLLDEEIQRATTEEQRIDQRITSEVGIINNKIQANTVLIEQETNRSVAQDLAHTQELSNKFDKRGDTITGELNMQNSINMNANRINNLPNPVEDHQPVTLGFLKSVIFDGGTF